MLLAQRVQLCSCCPWHTLRYHLSSQARLGLSCKMISRHHKTYNLLHHVLLLLHHGCERWEAVGLARASPLLFRVLDKIHLQGTDSGVTLQPWQCQSSCKAPLGRAVTSEDRHTYLLNMRKKGLYLVAELTEVRNSKSRGSRCASHSLGFSFTTLQMEALSTSALQSPGLGGSVGSVGVRSWEMFQRSHRCRLTWENTEITACQPHCSPQGTVPPVPGEAGRQETLPRKVRAWENVLQ